MKTSIRVIIFLLLTAGAQAQDSSISKLGFRFGTYFNSRLNMYGRTGGQNSSGLFPMAELWFNNAAYINAAPVFTISGPGGFEYAGSVATAGYLKNNGKSSVHLYITKPIYKENSHLVQSALKAQAAASFTKLGKILNVTGGAEAKLSDGMDWVASVGLDHLFKKQSGNRMLVIDPSAYVYAGTQRFVRSNYERKDFLFLPGTAGVTEEEVTKFNVLSFEFSAPVIFIQGKWMLLFTPAYVIPQNLIRSEDHPEISEKEAGLFYFTAGARVSL